MEDGKLQTPKGRFGTTHWSLVRRAACSQVEGAREALGDLCARYWHPLFRFARRRGWDEETSRDLTQGFFAHLLEKRTLRAADEARGRFRTFLISSFKNYMANEWNREHALKRGGGFVQVPLEPDPEREGRPVEGVEHLTPEQIYDREWAHAVLQNVLNRLGAEAEQRGGAERFQALRDCLTGEGDPGGYQVVGRRLGLSETAVKVAVYRLRQRFAQLLRTEIGATVESEAEIDSEIRCLFEALQR